MKVRPSVKPICEKCKIIKRKGRVMVICDVTANAVDIRQGDLNAFLPGKVDTCDSCHGMNAPPTCFAVYPAPGDARGCVISERWRNSELLRTAAPPSVLLGTGLPFCA